MGVMDALLSLKTQPKAKEATLEITGKPMPQATIGCKAELHKLSTPDLAIAITSGPIFASLLATSKLSVLNAYFGYMASEDVKFGATVQQGGDDAGAFSVGIAYKSI